jgi:hypothetical protein
MHEVQGFAAQLVYRVAAAGDGSVALECPARGQLLLPEQVTAAPHMHRPPPPAKLETKTS